VATRFNQKDASTCFNCHSNAPSFRLISLEKIPTDARQLEPGCLVGLFCNECLRFSLEGVFEGFVQSKSPLRSHESPDSCLCRQVGFAVVPLEFSQQESQLLIDELGTDCVEPVVN
jgi:hypothetical protein